MNNRTNKTPYLDITHMPFIVAGSTIMAALVSMVICSALIISLLIAFITLKIIGTITFGWGWVLSPIWIPMLFIFGAGAIAFISVYAINAGIFVKRLVTGKLSN